MTYAKIEQELGRLVWGWNHLGPGAFPVERVTAAVCAHQLWRVLSRWPKSRRKKLRPSMAFSDYPYKRGQK